MRGRFVCGVSSSMHLYRRTRNRTYHFLMCCVVFSPPPPCSVHATPLYGFKVGQGVGAFSLLSAKNTPFFSLKKLQKKRTNQPFHPFHAGQGKNGVRRGRSFVPTYPTPHPTPHTNHFLIIMRIPHTLSLADAQTKLHIPVCFPCPHEHKHPHHPIPPTLTHTCMSWFPNKKKQC